MAVNSSSVRVGRAILVGVVLAGLVVACGSEGDTPGTSAPVIPVVTTPPASGGAAGAAVSAAAGSGTTASSIPVVASGSAGAPAIGQPTTAAPPAGASADSTQWCGVKRTLDSRCTACHNEQKTAGAPMSLKTHADLMAAAVSDPSKKVFQLVGARVHDAVKPMPPQEQLTAEQLSGIDGWVAAGAPAGADPTCSAGSVPGTNETAAPLWPTNCDAVYKITSGGYTIGAGQETHPQVPVTAPWGNSAVQTIAWRAINDNPKVLHHWILYGAAGQFLMGWAPGKDTNTPMPDDVGLHLEGGQLSLDLHYNNLTGDQDETDDSGVELCILEEPHLRPQSAETTQALTSFLINIPARAVDYEAQGSCNVSAPVTILTASPHAHKYANHMKFTVDKQSGETVVMHDAPFHFEEQGSFALPKPLQLEPGDVINTVCTFTNPEDRTVTFGENTGNEMCFNFAVVYPRGALTCGGLGGPAFPRGGF